MRIYSKSTQKRRVFVCHPWNQWDFIMLIWLVSTRLLFQRAPRHETIQSTHVYTRLEFNIAPDKLPSQKKNSLQPLFFSGYVKLQECRGFFLRVVRLYRVSIYNPCAPQTLIIVFPYSSCSSPPLFLKSPCFKQASIVCERALILDRGVNGWIWEAL